MNRLPWREEKAAKWALEPRLRGLKGISCLLLWVTNRVLHLRVRSSRVEEIRLVSGVASGVEPESRGPCAATQGPLVSHLIQERR